jgi:hypothetical protein
VSNVHDRADERRIQLDGEALWLASPHAIELGRRPLVRLLGVRRCAKRFHLFAKHAREPTPRMRERERVVGERAVRGVAPGQRSHHLAQGARVRVDGRDRRRALRRGMTTSPVAGGRETAPSITESESALLTCVRRSDPMRNRSTSVALVTG